MTNQTCFHVRLARIPRTLFTWSPNFAPISFVLSFDSLIYLISAPVRNVFGWPSPREPLPIRRLSRPLYLASFIFIFCDAAKRCVGSTHLLTSQVWQIFFPFGIGPLNSSNETRWARRGVDPLPFNTNCPYPPLLIEPIHIRHFPTRFVALKNLVSVSGAPLLWCALRHLIEQTLDVFSLPGHGKKVSPQTRQERA